VKKYGSEPPTFPIPIGTLYPAELNPRYVKKYGSEPPTFPIPIGTLYPTEINSLLLEAAAKVIEQAIK